MNVSPLDLRQQRFRTAFRGFDRLEVTSLLNAVSEDYEAALREVDRLRQELARTEESLSGHREREDNLKSTLMVAQKLADDIKANADREARRIVREAEGHADLLMARAESRLEDAQREIDSLKLKRREAETSIESTLLALRATLDYVRAQDARDREGSAPLPRRRQTEDLLSGTNGGAQAELVSPM